MSRSVVSSLFCDSPGRVLVTGSFVATTGSSVGQQLGTGFVATKVSEGKYNVFLTEKYPAILYFSCEITSSAVGPDVLFSFNTLQSSLRNTNGSIDINLYTFSGGAFSPFDGDGLISICYVMQNTGITSK